VSIQDLTTPRIFVIGSYANLGRPPSHAPLPIIWDGEGRPGRLDLSGVAAVRAAKLKRQRRPDPIEMAKRALASGLDVRTISVTADAVTMTLNDGASDTAHDQDIIETPEQLRRLI
jgi:hypothetical protein